jgi:hypothetical protein
MGYAFLCPNCNIALAAEDVRGRSAHCDSCGGNFNLTVVPDPWAEEERGGSIASLGRSILYVLAAIGFVVSVLFAGCLMRF